MKFNISSRTMPYILCTAALLATTPRNALGRDPTPPQPPSTQPPTNSIAATAFRLPMLFAPNRGQMREDVLFAGWKGGVSSFLTARGFAVRFERRDDSVSSTTSTSGLAVEYAFEHALPTVHVTGEDARDTRFHFARGADPTKWESSVPTFGSIRYAGMYRGVDVVVHDASGTFVYDLVLSAGASLDDVKIRCTGVESMRIDSEGSLVCSTAFGELKQQQPRTWATAADGARVAIDSRFVLLDDSCYGFEAPHRDPSMPCLVDPGLTYGTYLGGSLYEHGCGVDVDPDCGTYITGGTLSLDYPTTLGSFDRTHNGDVDVFVTKINATGEAILYSTFLGGSNGDYGHGVRADNAGAAYVSGGTSSPNFPTTAGAADTTYNGGSDIFVTRLAPNGAALVYSTYVGGTGDDGAFGSQTIVIDATGNAFVAGYTNSTDFPVTAGVVDTTFNGVIDAFAFKLAPSGASITWATYFGGSDVDIANSVDIDDLGNTFLAGYALSNDYPISAGAYQSTPNASSNGIVTKLDANGATTLFSTFTGGVDVVRGISVESNELFAAGYTLTSSFPTTPGAYDTSYNGGTDGFLLRLNLTGTGATYATYLGGTGNDVVNDVDTDNLSQAYVSGATDSTDFPTTAEAFDATYNGSGDSYCSRLSQDGSALQYSTYIGGTNNDTAYAINVHAVGAFYMTGSTFSVDFPTTLNAVDTTANGSEDVFVVQLSAGPTACTSAAAYATYGIGKADSSGNIPALSMNLLPTVPAYHMLLSVQNCTANAPLFLVIGTATAAMPFDGGTLLVSPSLVVNLGLTDSAGGFTLLSNIADNANFCGDTLALQAVVLDTAMQSTYQTCLSNGVLLTLGN